jgi:pimeloyl-ACP methyl ester carboxylesterase
VIASKDWLAAIGASFSAAEGETGLAHLNHYSAGYRIWGDGPPLILIPGLAGGMELLTPLTRELSKHFRVISYQLRGEDDCFLLRRRFTLDDLVNDLAEFIAWQHLECPIVFGVSFGGVLALELAARFSNQLRALIVQGAGAKFEHGLLQQVAGVVLSRYPLPTDSPFVNQFFNLLFGRAERKGPLFEFVTRQCWETDQSVMAHRFHLVEQFDLEGRMERISAPTLILSGDRDLLVSEQSLQALRQGIPNNRTVRLSGCGHLGFVSQPRRVAAEVKAFLERANGKRR